MSETLILARRLCLRCSHEWVPRQAAPPVNCPRCKSPYWDRPRRDLHRQKRGSK